MQRVGWEKEEAVILLDALIKLLDGKLTRKETLDLVSKTLRNRKILSGEHVDEVFRNTNGIDLMINIMEYVYTDGAHGLKKEPMPQLFVGVVDLYKNNREEFDAILAKEMGKGVVSISSNSIADSFAKWLKTTDTSGAKHPDKVVRILLSLSDILVQKQLIDFWILDNPNSTEILALMNVLADRKNLLFHTPKEFKYSYKALKLYHHYLIEFGDTLSINGSNNAAESAGFVNDKSDNQSVENSSKLLDFENITSLSHTIPLSVMYNSNASAAVKSWVDAYNFVLSQLVGEFPDKIVPGVCFGNSGRLDIADDNSKTQLRKPKKLSALLWYESNLSATDICRKIKGALDLCDLDYDRVEIKYVKSNVKKDLNRGDKTVDIAKSELSAKQKSEIEKVILAIGIEGTTCENLKNGTGIPEFTIRKSVSEMDSIVEIKDKLIHKNAFVDFDEGAEELEQIIDKLMEKYDGYISCGQLYDYTRSKMNMFLNDNDIDDERSVYNLAQYLFEKAKYHNKQYKFSGNMHISLLEVPISNMLDLIDRFSDEHGGVFYINELTEYMRNVGMSVGNLRHQMQLLSKPRYFYFNEGEIVSARILNITDEWKSGAASLLELLFADIGDHVILRNIPKCWFDRLPFLPETCGWTPLLLQGILRFYGDELGARTIPAMEGQSIDTLHSMLVKTDSPIVNFADAVIAYFIDEEIEQRQFEAESLRVELVRSGMIKGNELIYNMPKALKNDSRFAWDAMRKNVTIHI